MASPTGSQPNVREFPMLHRQLYGWGIFIVGIGLAAFLLIALLTVGDGLITGIGVAGASLMALVSVTTVRGILAARLVLDSDSIRMHSVGFHVEAPWRDARLDVDGRGRPTLRLKNPRVSFEWWLDVLARVFGMSSRARSSLHNLPLYTFAAAWPDNPLASAIGAFAPDLMEPSSDTTGRGA